MSELHLVTGTAGVDHVTSADDGALLASIFGRGQYVVHGFEHEMVDNNTMRIKEGSLVINGRHAIIGYGDSITVGFENGSVGRNRIDLVVATYNYSLSGESASIDVIKGTSYAGTPVAPSYVAGDILKGDTIVQMPLYSVLIEGINIESVTPVFTRSNPMQALYNMIIPPVGWIEYNETGINPENRYPGTGWELAGIGAVDVCVDSSVPELRNAGQIVGANTGSLVAANIPKHTHPIGEHKHLIGTHTHNVKSGTLTTLVAGSHQHRGFVVRDLAAGTAKDRIAQESVSSASSTSNFITAPKEPSAPYNGPGNHTHSFSFDVNTGNPNSDKSTTGGLGVNGNTLENSGTGSEFSLMQKSYLVYRWKRIR